jgi:hypothetical protein
MLNNFIGFLAGGVVVGKSAAEHQLQKVCADILFVIIKYS